jgi:polysaccharide deacetylase 2 family uncharacterized protein YibQ
VAWFAGWRGLGLFWLGILVICGAGGGLLHYLGPPLPRVAAVSPAGSRPPAETLADAGRATGGRAGAARSGTGAEQPAGAEAGHAGGASPDAAGRGKADTPPPAKPPPLVVQRQVAPPPNQPGRDQPGPVTDPDPALLEAGPDGAAAMLPRVALDGRMPMQVYAAGFDRSSRRVRIAILVAGIGLSEADSLNAIKTLPAGVSFAVSPYGGSFDRVLTAARLAQHEYLLSIPMEPQSFPLSDPGSQALMTSIGRPGNMKRLMWVMSRFGGYVGATGALGDLRGERFAGLSDQMGPILAEFSRRGLLYVDPRPDQPAPPLVWGRGIDLVIDEPVKREAIDARLAELEAIAREKGSALGLAGAPRPVTVDRLLAWTGSLADKGFVLAPISAIVTPPPKDAAP